MTSFLIPALIRIILAAGGGALLAKYGINSDAVTGVVTSGASLGGIIIGLVPIVVAGIWAHFSTTAGALIDKAVTVSGGALSPLAASAPQAKVVAKTGKV